MERLNKEPHRKSADKVRRARPTTFRPFHQGMVGGDLFFRGVLPKAAVFGLVLADSLFRRLPLVPGLPTVSLDGSWMRVMQEAFLHRRAFGREIVFTYGPWSFSLSPLYPLYHPSLYGIQLIIQSLLILLVAVSTWQIGGSVSRRPLFSVAAAAGLCFVITEIGAIAGETLYFLLIWYLAVFHFWESSDEQEDDGATTSPIRARLVAAA